MIKFQIDYSRKAKKFLKSNAHRLTKDDVRRLILNGLRKLDGEKDVTCDLEKLHGRWAGRYRVRQGSIRIIFRVEKTAVYVVFIEEVGFRGDVYKLREEEAVYLTDAERSRQKTKRSPTKKELS